MTNPRPLLLIVDDEQGNQAMVAGVIARAVKATT